MNLAEKQQQVTTQLAALDGGQDRLVFLVEKAKSRPALRPEFRVEKNLIPGCLARLWFVADFREGKCFFDGDSDSIIVKAIAGFLWDFYSGQSPADILAHDPAFLGPLGITQHLTPNRRNALARVWEYIQQFASEHSATTWRSAPPKNPPGDAVKT
ncbi:MAG: SufE family protein [Verrucomicrobiota bacterium]